MAALHLQAPKSVLVFYCYVKNPKSRDFPGGAVVENLPANAGDTGSSPVSGKIPHAAEQVSPCATTAEAHAPQLLKPTCLEPVLRNKRSHRNEKHVHHNEE